MRFATFCDTAFSQMERNIALRTDGVIWVAGQAIPALTVVEKSGANGIWHARADDSHGLGVAGISLMLRHGELRVGALVPSQVFGSAKDRAMLALSPDGNPPSAVREVLGGWLYDRSYQGEPFTPSFIIDAYENPDKAEAIALTMAALVASQWKAAFDTIARHDEGGLGFNIMLRSVTAIPLRELKQKIAIVIRDSSYNDMLGYYVRAASAHDENVVRQMLADAGIEGITVDAYVESRSFGPAEHQIDRRAANQERPG